MYASMESDCVSVCMCGRMHGLVYSIFPATMSSKPQEVETATFTMKLMSNTAASYPMGAGHFEPWLFVNCYRGRNVLHPLDRKLQYCSSVSCCIYRRSYEPLQNQQLSLCITKL